MPCMGRPAPPPPAPVSQPAFKFKRFGIQFQVQSFCCWSFFFSVADFFSRTKFFIDIDNNYSNSFNIPCYLLKSEKATYFLN
jgi:hypothetical protein